MIDFITSFWNKMCKEKITLCSSFFVGMIVHLYMIANKLPNHDDMYGLFQAIDQPASGRWFLKWPAAISGDISISFNGVLAIIYVSIAAAALVHVLKIKNDFLAGVIGALMAVFPTITCTMSYMAWVDAYAFALMFAGLAVCLGMSRHPICWMLSVALLTMSMGIYQAYFPYAAVVFVMLHIVKCVEDEETNKQIFLSGVKCVCILLLAMLSYMTMVKITTASGGLTDYGGIDTMGQIALADIPVLVGRAYSESIGFFLNDNRYLHYFYIDKLMIMTWIVTIAGIAYLMIRNTAKEKKIRTIILFLASAVLPLGAGLVYVMVGDNRVHVLMLYAYIALILTPIVILDMVLQKKKEDGTPNKGKSTLIGVMETIILVTCFTLIFNYSIRANQYYFTFYMAKEQSTAFNTTLMTQIKEQTSYTTNKIIVFAGSYKEDVNMPWYFANNELMEMTGIIERYEKVYSYPEYLYYFMDNKNPILTVDTNVELEALVGIPDLDNVPRYPNNSSIIEVGDYIIVKFSNLRPR